MTIQDLVLILNKVKKDHGNIPINFFVPDKAMFLEDMKIITSENAPTVEEVNIGTKAVSEKTLNIYLA